MLQVAFPFLVNIAICWSYFPHQLWPRTYMKMTSKITNVITQHKECWSMLFNIRTILGMLLKFRKVVINAGYHGASQGPSNPMGYCHVQKRDGLFHCTNKSCAKKSSNSKQLKMGTICPHLHILFCVLKMSSDSGRVNTVSPSTSGESSSATSTTVTAEQEVSVSRGSTIKLNMRRVIPYPVPQKMLSACQSLRDVPQCFMPSSTECELCGSPLLDCRRHPGQGQEDLLYLITPVIFISVEIKVKFCSNRSCKAMHQAWPIDKGNLFNNCLVLLYR